MEHPMHTAEAEPAGSAGANGRFRNEHAAFPPSGTFAGLRAALPALAAEAQARAESFERARALPADFATRLKEAGAYRVLVSRERGGLGATLGEWLEMVMTLAEADASTGWTVGHGALCSALIENTADEALLEEFFFDPLASAAWSNLGAVEVKEVPGGLRISGRWSFGTGCTAATHLGGMLRVPAPAGPGSHRFIVALARRGEARIDETWDPVGLAATGSHDIVFDDVFVPWSRTFTWPDSQPNGTGPAAVLVPGTWFVTLCAAATHLGLARRALDEARRTLTGKLDRFTRRPVLEKPALLHRLEEAEGLLFACRAGVEKAVDEVWRTGCRGTALDAEARLRVRLAATTAVHQGERIVRAAYDAAGAAAIRRAGPLQRLLRDASCLTHHVSANLDSFEVVGRVRCGFDPPTFRV
jgi:alkylation response protein AidB-like acyl-CoA dehydrogenase